MRVRSIRSRFGPEPICVVLGAETAAAFSRLLKRAGKQAKILELRLDYLANSEETLRFLDSLRGKRRRARLIATCRSRRAGGRFGGSIQAQLATLQLAAESGCDWVDLEIESAIRIPPPVLQGVVGRAHWILSYHNFKEVPNNVEMIASELVHFPGRDVVKVAARANSFTDWMRLLDLARKRIITVPMGEPGLPGRVLALRAGSPLAYASWDEPRLHRGEQPMAPGQLSYREMSRVYRAHRLDRRTCLYGVIGSPGAAGHSLSPVMQNAAFQARRMNAAYLPFAVDDLARFIEAIPRLGLAGFSVTIPHKETLVRYLDDCDLVAARIGAVNTVVVRGGGQLYGYNTDYVGVLRPLERVITLKKSRVCVLGAGGAARAVVWALKSAGVDVAIVSRRAEKAKKLARAAGAAAIPRSALRHLFFDAIVNATPVGMHPDERACPLARQELNCHVVFDLVYQPRETALLRMARREGKKIVPGWEMLVEQGAAQFEIWTGTRAPVKVMRNAVLEALRREETRR